MLSCSRLVEAGPDPRCSRHPVLHSPAMLSHCAYVVALSVAVVLQAPARRTSAAPDSASEAGWTSLFNGKDLTGWKVSKPESFTVENGAIAASGRASHAYYDGPFLGHTFRNFELKVDVKVKANAIRSRPA